MDSLPTIADAVHDPADTQTPRRRGSSQLPTESVTPAVGVLSIAPLVREIEGAGGMSACRALGAPTNDQRLYYTLRKRGTVSIDQADRLAVGLLRRMPYTVWTWDEWSAALPESDS